MIGLEREEANPETESATDTLIPREALLLLGNAGRINYATCFVAWINYDSSVLRLFSKP